MNEFERLRRRILINQDSGLVLFESGKVNLGFEQGPIDSNYIGSIDITSEYLFQSRKYKGVSIVTSVPYDLSKYNEIAIEWEQTEEVSNAYFVLQVSTTKTGNRTLLGQYTYGKISRSEQIFDISSINANRYISIYLSAAEPTWVYLYTYKITLR